MFVLGLLFCGLVLSSCGSDEEEKNDELKYDCDCYSLVKKSGKKFNSKYDGQIFLAVKSMSSDGLYEITQSGEVFNGTCAILSKNRKKTVLGLFKYKDGYPVKKQKWYEFNGEKILIWDLDYNDKNEKTGYRMSLGRFERQDSITKTKYTIAYTNGYEEFNNNRNVYWYNFTKSEDKGWYINAENAQVKLGIEECWNQLPKTSRKEEEYNYDSGEFEMVEKFDVQIIKDLNTQNALTKKYIDCIASKKLKKWYFNEMKIDESANEGKELDVDED